MVALTGREHSITVVCHRCSDAHVMLVNNADVAEWQLGKYIQDAMPYLSADERELLISQTCDKCWKEMFGTCEE